MCLIAFQYQDHPEYELIFIANRDERYSRPTQPAHFWHDRPKLLAGRDLEGKGTWMGITRKGRFTALTNFRNPSSHRDDAPSRGNLTRGFLEAEGEVPAYLNQLMQQGDRYNGFNLLAGTIDELYYYSNKIEEPQKIEPGLHGLSNHLLDIPWPKVERAKERLSKITSNRVFAPEELFDILDDREQAPDDQLPETGVGLELERKLSPIFIETEQYGTRCSSVVTVDKEGWVNFIEKTYDPDARDYTRTRHFEFRIEG